MPRPQKIKRHKMKTSYRARPHPLTVILTVAVIAGLVFLGISIYDPVYNFIVNRDSRPEVSMPDVPDAGPEDGENPVAEPDEPEPVRPDTVDGLRAVYANTELLRDGAALAAFLDTLSGSGINAVMVDLKDQDGVVLYNSRSADAARWQTLSETPYDLDAVAAALEQRGLHLIARMSAFRDEPAARGDIDNAIHYQDSESMLWLDNYADAGGRPWLNPYAPGTQRYLSDLATEAVDRGAVMVVLIDYQFPNGSLDANVGFSGHDRGQSRSQVLRDFADGLADTLAEGGARLALYYPATVFSQASTNELRFGGAPEAILGGGVELQLGALPYSFTADYSSDGLVVEQPLADAAATVSVALQYVQERVGADTAVSALLQGGTESTVPGQTMTAETVQAQIQTAGDMGVQEYVLYCTDSAAYFIQ